MDPEAGLRPRGFRALGADPPSPSRTGEPAVAAPAASESPVEYLGEPITRSKGWRWAIAAASVLVVALFVIAALAFRLGSTSASEKASSSATPTRTPAATATPLAVPDLYQQVAPSVVVITTSKGSLGSGTIVTATGTVLTANHVVSDGGAVSIRFADGTKTAAVVASADPKTDVAMLTPKKLPEVVVPATLGGGITVGADVVAIGNPLGLTDSTTIGVASGLDRTATTRDVSGKKHRLAGLIQFDAAVNPGSSGGPLLNTQGLVVGVVVAIADPGHDDAFAGIGFAVPIGTALGGGSGDGPGGGPAL